MWEEQLVDPPIDYMLIFASFFIFASKSCKIEQKYPFHHCCGGTHGKNGKKIQANGDEIFDCMKFGVVQVSHKNVPVLR